MVFYINFLGSLQRQSDFYSRITCCAHNITCERSIMHVGEDVKCAQSPALLSNMNTWNELMTNGN